MSTRFLPSIYLAGYNVYRSEANGSTVKLNSELVKSPSYRDSAVSSGKTYVYSVSAVDLPRRIQRVSQRSQRFHRQAEFRAGEIALLSRQRGELRQDVCLLGFCRRC